MTTKKQTFKARSGFDSHGELAEPAGTGKAPGVVLVHEWWGVNDHVRDLATRLADAGFVVLVADVYDGKVATDAESAAALMTAMDTLRAVDQIAGAAAFLRSHPRCNGKVGVTGLCMGGALSFAAACHVEGLGAAVPFYGVPPADKVDYAKVTAPIQAHFAKRDEWAPVSKAEEIKKALDGRGHPMELHVYDADHAFVNDTRPDVYSKESATLAWGRMVAFFQKHLA